MSIPQTPSYVPNRPCKTPSYNSEEIYNAPDTTYFLGNLEEGEEPSAAGPSTSKVETVYNGPDATYVLTYLEEESPIPEPSSKVVTKRKKKTVPKIISKLIKKNKKKRDARKKRRKNSLLKKIRFLNSLISYKNRGQTESRATIAKFISNNFLPTVEMLEYKLDLILEMLQ